MSFAFHPQTDIQAESIVKTLEDMLRAYGLEFKGNWDQLPHNKYGYNNSFHASITMTLFEVFYGRGCKSPMGSFDLSVMELIGSNFVLEAMEKVKTIREKLKTAQSHQNSYSDVRRRDLKFNANDWFYLKVSPIKGVVQFGKKVKLSPKYVGPYKIVRRVGKVAYELQRFP